MRFTHTLLAMLFFIFVGVEKSPFTPKKIIQDFSEYRNKKIY
jgi:hypothetical protein